MKKPPQFNIGWEVEAIRKPTHIHPGVMAGYDTSVGGEQAEYRLDKEMIGDNRHVMWLLKTVMQNPRFKMDGTCGYHIHLSPVKDGRKTSLWAGWMMTLGQCIETEMFRAIPKSRSNNRFCWLLAEQAPNSFHPIKVRYPSSKYHNDYRHAWIHPTEIYRPGGIGTVEIRNMGEAQDYVYLHAWTMICLFMAQKAWGLIDDPSGLHTAIKEMSQELAPLITYQRGGNRRQLTNCAILTGNKTGYYDDSPLPGLVALGSHGVRPVDELHRRNENTANSFIQNIAFGDRLSPQSLTHNHVFSESAHSLGGGTSVSLPTPYLTKSCSACNEYSRYVTALEKYISDQQDAALNRVAEAPPLSQRPDLDDLY